MISFHNGDLLTSGCDYICHQVNLQGCFGGGLALQIATKYPQCEQFCKYFILGNDNLGGRLDFYRYDRHKQIINCFSQNLNFSTNYNWLKKCFKQILIIAKKQQITTIGVPYKYGCGIATGDWNKVLKIFTQIFENEKDIDFQIWKL